MSIVTKVLFISHNHTETQFLGCVHCLKSCERCAACILQALLTFEQFSFHHQPSQNQTVKYVSSCPNYEMLIFLPLPVL